MNPTNDTPRAILIPLSAKNKERLMAYVKKMVDFVEANPEVNLINLAYTLQVGRVAMEERLGLIVTSVAELKDKLHRFLKGEEGLGNLYLGQVKRNKEMISSFEADEDFHIMTAQWIEKRKYSKILDFWVKGLHVDWNKLYMHKKPQRISLPTYPFADEKYWIGGLDPNFFSSSISRSAQLHPLLHENQSTIFKEVFSSTFTGNEFFLKDHVIRGQKVLPGAAQIEMAYVAMRQASGDFQTPLQLKHISWKRPFCMDDVPQTVHIAVSPEENNAMAYEVYSGSEQDAIIHSQGTALFTTVKELKSVDMAALQAQPFISEHTSKEIYEIFNDLGLCYGPGQQSIHFLRVLENAVLAKLHLPESVVDTLNAYTLHPSLLDGALQASIGFKLKGSAIKLMLPFSLDSLEVFGKSSASMWALVRPYEGHTSEKFQKLDIDLCDEAGNIVVQMRGFSSLAVEEENVGRGMLLFQPVAKEKTADKSMAKEKDVQEIKSPEIDTQQLSLKIQRMLQEIASKILNLPIEKLDVDSELSEYGFDSITLTDFANQVANKYHVELTPTIFFEYPTIESCAKYLSVQYGAKLASHFAVRTLATAESAKELPETSSLLDHRLRFKSSAKDNSTLGAKSQDLHAPIAIVGMSGAFPKAHDLEEFWGNLLTGKDCISEIPEDRWDWRAIWGDPTQEDNKTNVKWGGFLDNISEFDPLFFGISPREALLMDPQQRLLMEYVWLAIENAGYAAKSLSGTNTGMFIGTASSGYEARIEKAHVPIEGYTATGMVPSVGPNRMSFFLNFHGPSEPIETACSSSLVAIHHAIMAIHTGDCDQAIAGGINAIVSPEVQISFNKAGMLSPDGRCKTISKNANGYGRGEGVGMLFLKKLSDAEASGDRIYAVIRSSAVNHGGRANSLTAPNSKAQADLLITAYNKAGIDPRTVSYIEAHGTGTSLGDPVEVNGLKAAFKELYQSNGDLHVERAHCGLGTVKSNIGHLELAAGVAGIIKVVLQMQHKTLVKTLHAEEQNPYIDLKGSPFYIVKDNQDWKAVEDANGSPLPRIAGVSSFGFGGTNAHIVIQEYIPKQAEGAAATMVSLYVIIPISAKNKERLKVYVKKILAFIEKNADLNLADVSYTLQMGREAMEERLGLIVDSMEELKVKLRKYLNEDESIDNLHAGQVKQNKEIAAIFEAHVELNEAIDKLIEHGKFSELLNFWVKGVHIDWKKLYTSHPPRKISLPTYPFAKDVFWIDGLDTVPKALKSQQAAPRQPLMLESPPTTDGSQWKITLSGDEFYLKDHLVMGQKVLPGVAYLEMAQSRIRQTVSDPTRAILLKDIVWSKPVVVKDCPQILHMSLTHEAKGEITYEFYSEANGKTTIHSRGKGCVTSTKEVNPLDVQALRAKPSIREISAKECYAAFEKMGLNYGPAHRAIDSLLVMENEVLANLLLPSSVADTLNSYVLHPSLLDGALQASLGLFLKNETVSSLKLRLPYALDSIEILGACASSMLAWIRQASRDPSSPDEKLDIDLCDASGNISVRMRGLSLQEVADESENIGTLLLHPVWKEKAANGLSSTEINTQVVELPEGSFEEQALALFELVRKVILDSPANAHLIQVVISDLAQFGLAALLKTAHLENPRIYGQVLLVQDENRHTEKLLQENRSHLEDQEILYRQGKRFVKSLEECPKSPLIATSPWKDKGVYLITGGAGGLGLLFAKEIAAKTKNATIILAGRSALNEGQEALLNNLRALSANVIYVKEDITQREAVKNLIEIIQLEYGGINGILHCAGIIRDNFIIKKSSAEFKQVLLPKVVGTLNLDEATKDMQLDFFVLFSSLAGAFGNVGQADYATANGFMDAFAETRQNQVVNQTRYGQTISFNWPFWQEGGMHIDQVNLELMKMHRGLVPLPSKEGIAAFNTGFSSGYCEVLVMQGLISQLKSAWVSGSAPVKASDTEIVDLENIDLNKLKDDTLNAFKILFGESIKVSPNKIDVDESFQDFGVDSILMAQLYQKLERVFGELPKTLFFDLPSIRALTDYFVSKYPHICLKWTLPKITME